MNAHGQYDSEFAAERMMGILRKVELRGALLMLRLKLFAYARGSTHNEIAPYPSVAVEARLWVPDATETNALAQPKQIVFVKDIEASAVINGREEDLLLFIGDLIRCLMQHEVDEGFWHDGRCVRDPHAA